MLRTSHIDSELALSNPNVTVASDPSVPNRTLPTIKWIYSLLNLLVVIFTLNIPNFHASLSRISDGLGIRAAISIWKAVRTLDSLLVSALIAVLFKADAQANASFFFFCSCSLLQAVIGLISSTILIICFSAYHTNNEYVEVETVDQLDFLFWSVWDLFSVPSIWTSWSIVTFTITLLINFTHTATLTKGVDGNGIDYSSLDSAHTMLVVLICVSVVCFGLFLFHLHHLSGILASDR